MNGDDVRRYESSRESANRYDPMTCQSVVNQFYSIITNLWSGFENLDRTKDPTAVYNDILEPIGNALEAQIVFLARVISPRNKSEDHHIFEFIDCRRFTNGSWKKAKYDGKSFTSGILKEALDNDDGVICCVDGAFRKDEKNFLKRLTSDLVVSRLSFGSDQIFFIGASGFRRIWHKDSQIAERSKLLKYIPELVAAPLRIENERIEIDLFEKAAARGSIAETLDVGERILRPRVQLAWLAREIKDAQTLPTTSTDRRIQVPTLSGEYDYVFAHHIDATRYSSGVTYRDKSVSSDPTTTPVGFAALFSPETDKKLILFTSSDGMHDRKNSFLLADQALLSRHAAARGLLWLAYKTGSLSGGDRNHHPCPFSRVEVEERSTRGKVEGNSTDPSSRVEHKHCNGKDSLCLELFEEYTKIPPEKKPEFINPKCIYASWLRSRWLEVHYRARQIREHPGENTDKYLADCAEKYSSLTANTDHTENTGEFFREALASLEKREKQKGKLRIDWRWLYLWFIAETMTSTALNERFGEYDKASGGIDPHVTHYLHTSTAVLFGLHLLRFWESETLPEFWDLPELRPHDLTDARIYLLCEYAYREIGVDHAWQLEHHLRSQFEPEMVLYTARPGHRDHAFHVVDVCLLGHILLTSENGNRNPSILGSALLGKKVKHRDRKLAQVLRQWYPAALLHDTGVAIGLAKSISGMLKGFTTPDLKDYRDAVSKAVKSAHEELDKQIAEKLEKVGLKISAPKEDISYDHGIVSVHHLIQTLEQRTGGLDFVKKPENRKCLQAILRHNRTAEKIHPDEDPLACLLLLCDHLHEWARIRVRPQHLARAFLSSFQMSMPLRAEAEQAAAYLVPNASFDLKNGILVFRNGRPVFTIHYLASRSRLMEAACQWVDICAESERVILGNSFPAIELRLVHPQTDTLKKAVRPESEMELLRDYAVTPQGNFLADWISYIDRPHSKRTALRYEIEGDRSEETFVLQFGSRTGKDPRLLPYIPDEFYAEFFKWKERKLGLASEDL